MIPKSTRILLHTEGLVKKEPVNLELLGWMVVGVAINISPKREPEFLMTKFISISCRLVFVDQNMGKLSNVTLKLYE